MTKEKIRRAFFLPMVPPTVTAQEHEITVRNGKPRLYDPPELREAKQKLAAYLAPHAPPRLDAGPIRLLVKWCFPRGQHPDGAWKDTRPDTDNLQKALKDCMTRLGFWRDDAQVASEICEKFWAEVPGIYIEVTQL